MLIFNQKRNLYKRSIFSLEFILHSILLTLSLFSILKCKIKKISTCVYSISLPSSNGKIDFRSKYITDCLDLNKSINIIRSTNFINSIKFYINNPNTVYYLTLEYFSLYFNKNNNASPRLTIKKIFTFLNINKFISIDDQRVMLMFLDICEKLKILSIGYMHYKFNNHNKEMRLKTFDIFFVWSKYFKKKLIKINHDYKNKKIIISGIKKKKKFLKQKTIHVLIVLDLHADHKFLLRLAYFLSKKKLNIAIKFKPSSNKKSNIWINFCVKNNIPYFKSSTFSEISDNFNINYFLAFSSTALYQACLYGAEPLMIKNKSPEASEILNERIIRSCNKNVKQILKNVLNAPIKKKISKQLNIFWGDNYNKIKIKKILGIKNNYI